MSLGIILIGALGRMGKEIAEQILSDNNFTLTAAVEHTNHPEIGKDYGVCLGKGMLHVPLTTSINMVSTTGMVGIDFSSPQALKNNIPDAARLGLPMVIGTTGLTREDNEYAQSFSSKIPILISPNMSLGVNLLFLLTELVSKKINNDYDIEIIEAHHRFKKDAPSGTAKRLGEIVAQTLGESYESSVKNGRVGIATTDRTRKEIGMHAIRGGDIVGDHTVLFAGIGESIELRHRAHSRTTFAHGSLLAAKWLSGQQSGFYSMRDMLGL